MNAVTPQGVDDLLSVQYVAPAPRELWRTSPNTGELAKALTKAQAALGPAAKDSKNPHLKNTYASLTAVWEACRQPLADAGLALVQAIISNTEAGDVVGLISRLEHGASGQYYETETWVPIRVGAGRSYVQELGACVTYLRRYHLGALLGIVTEEDDDGAPGRPPAGDGQPPKSKPRQRSRVPAPSKTKPPEPPAGNGEQPTATAAELFPQDEDEAPKKQGRVTKDDVQAYKEGLTEDELEAYKSWKGVRYGLRDNVERYKLLKAVDATIALLFPDIAGNAPVAQEFTAGQARVDIYRAVKIYAALRNQSLEQDEAKERALQAIAEL